MRAALSASVAYLAIYAVMNLGAFACVTILAEDAPGNRLADYRGAARRRPVVAGSLAFFLVCLAGLPPGLVGLFAKVVVFRAVIDGGYGWLAVVMAVNTVVALYYYLAWTATLFAPADGPERARRRAPLGAGLAVGAALALAVAFSALPQGVLTVLDGVGP